MNRRTGERRRFFRHPAQVLVTAFLGAILLGTVLLTLPVSTAGPTSAPLITAAFTATSAVCVTGLVTVDTPTYWSGFGQTVIVLLIQVGGFGIMTLASLIALFLARHIGLRTRLTAAAETKSIGPGDVRRVLFGVLRITVVVEAAVALVLFARFRTAYGMSWGESLAYGGFHAVSSFNNAGFALFSDNMIGFAQDPLILLPLCVAIIVGGLGFPVILELWRRVPMRRWSLHTKLTLFMTAILLLGGTVFVMASEWNNPATIGHAPFGVKLLDGFFHAVQPRTAGFNAWDYSAATNETLLGTIMLMFIGGGSAGTAGGLKVTTFVVLFFVIIAEVRGEADVVAFDRRIAPRAIRSATTVALLGIAAVLGATMILTEVTDLPLREGLFESTSAFATVGLSLNVTATLPTSGQLVIIGLMFLGRLGPITLVSALALRERGRHYTLPEGAPLIG
ncbi:MAG: TrkH family potassium uptake protein [Nostocoides sp.]